MPYEDWIKTKTSMWRLSYILQTHKGWDDAMRVNRESIILLEEDRPYAEGWNAATKELINQR